MAQELGEAGAASSPWKQPESCRSRRAAGCAGRDAQLIAKRGPAKRPNADERAELVPIPWCGVKASEGFGKLRKVAAFCKNPENFW